MSSYKAPENTAVFISSQYPKKIIATDHTHSDLALSSGGGDVTAAGNNIFSGNNSFTGENLVMRLRIVPLLHTRLMED